jgi:cytochrome P450
MEQAFLRSIAMEPTLPHPIGSPPWWQLICWIIDPLGFQERNRQRLGDIFTMNLSGLGPLVLVGDPRLIAEIFSQEAAFDSGRGNRIAEPLLGVHSLLLLDGERHQRERRLLMPSFHGERLRSYAEQICRIATTVSDGWLEGQRLIARSEMQKISLEVIVQVVFGLGGGERSWQLKALLTDWINLTDSPLRSSMLFFSFLQKDWGPWSPWGRMKRHQRRIHALLQEEIEARRSATGTPGTDMLSQMIGATDEQGHPMTDAELRDELLTMLFAGHETTATVLAWALYLIHRHPEVRDRLLAELDALGPDPAPMDRAQLPYLTAVCQETLRLYPVIPAIFARIPRAPVQLAGQTFAAETYLMPSIHLVHSRADLYPEPHRFRPERFLEHTYAPSEYLPFGGGRRRCLGYALAEMEMKLVLAVVLSGHRLALADQRAVKPQRRGFTLAPRGGVPMVVTARGSA